MNRTATLLWCAVLFAVVSVGEQFLGQERSFSVASIRANKSSGRGFWDAQPNRFIAVRVTVKSIIAAYNGVFPNQVIGGPRWIDTDRWDMDGRLDEPLVSVRRPAVADYDISVLPPMAPMVQALLKERFGLKAHREKRSLPVYELVVAKSGAKIRKVADAPIEMDESLVQLYRGGGGPLPPGSYSSSFGSFNGFAVPIRALTNHLRSNLDRLVIDNTNLKGAYDIKLQWDPNFGKAEGERIPNLSASTFPSLFTAIQEQLGLRLDATNAPVDTVVIDSIQRPSEN
jgi:uncharacterized protein (TIGR03435 family)